MKNETITETLVSTANPARLFFDWFCKDSSLTNKGRKLMQKLRAIAGSTKFDNDRTYVLFKNNCPLDGSLYDDLRICDLATGDVIYTVVPSSGFRFNKGKAVIWGRENNFAEPILEGTWREIKNWFLNA